MLLPVVWIVLANDHQGTVIAGANASRWLQIPFVGISFQPPLSQLWYYLFCSKVFVQN
jgi:cell division protein FtsW